MPAVDVRRMLAALIAAEGVNSSGDFKVSQRAAGANMSVDVAAGSAVVKDDHVGANAGGYYPAVWTGVENVTVTAAHASLPRIDRVVLRIHDAYLGDADNVISIVVVAGTPTAGATLANTNGAAALPDSSLLLANVLVPAASSSVIDANIDTTGASNNSPAVRALVTVVGAFAAGMMMAWAGAAAPSGWLLCDGTAVSRTAYAQLFNQIGTTYGVGDGSTTFNVPDARGRALYGKGTHADVNALANSDGAAVGSRSPKHIHTYNQGQVVAGYSGGASNALQSNAGTNTSGNTGLNDAGGYLVINQIIKT